MRSNFGAIKYLMVSTKDNSRLINVYRDILDILLRVTNEKKKVGILANCETFIPLFLF